MWMSTEDARSDVILAGATAVFGVVVVQLLRQLPLYPGPGLLDTVLNLAWVFALTGLVPILLTRYRELGPESYGLDSGRPGLSAGFLLAAPIVVAGVLRGIATRGSILHALLGRFSPLLEGDPTVSGDGIGVSNILIDGILALVLVAILSVGALVLYTFLTVRGRDAFARHDMSVTEAIRTYGMVAAASALVFGVLRSFGSDVSALGVLINVAALVGVVLLGDRLVPAGAQTSRSAILTPLVVASLMFVLQTRGDLLFGLYAGSLAAGLVIVIASVVEGRAFAWAIIPPIVAMAVYPTCLNTVTFGVGGAFGC